VLEYSLTALEYSLTVLEYSLTLDSHLHNVVLFLKEPVQLATSFARRFNLEYSKIMAPVRTYLGMSSQLEGLRIMRDQEPHHTSFPHHAQHEV